MNTLHDFYEQRLLPQTPLNQIFSALNPIEKHNRFEIDCPQCNIHEAFVYKNTGVIQCNRRAKCDYNSNLLGYLNGGIQPNGDDYVNIIKDLCDKAGVSFPEEIASTKSIEAVAQKSENQKILNAFIDVTCQLLAQSDQAKTYLDHRGISIEYAKKMRIGFYPEPSIVSEELRKKNILAVEMKEAGVYRDDWQSRIIMPIIKNGEICDIIARGISEPCEVKYSRMNGEKAPDNTMILGLDWARDEIILVEGIFDYLALDCAGIKNVASVGGSKLWEGHIKHIVTSGIKKVTIFLDNDQAGINGTKEIIAKLGNIDIDLHVISPERLGDSKDQNEFLKKHGPEELRKLLAQTECAFRWIARRIVIESDNGECVDDTPKKKDIVRAASEFADKIQSKNRRIDLNAFWEELSEQGGIDDSIIDEIKTDNEIQRRKAASDKIVAQISLDISAARKNGDFNKVTELLQQRTQELIKINNNEDKFRDLFQPYTQDRIIDEFSQTSPNIATGFYLSGGTPLEFPSGAITIIAGATSHGKTTLEINLLLGVLKNDPQTVGAFLTFEEEPKKIIVKTLNAHIGLPLNNGGNVKAMYHYFGTIGKPGENPLKYISQNGSEFVKQVEVFFADFIENGRMVFPKIEPHVEELCDAIRALKKGNPNLRVVIVDYIQQLYSKNQISNRYEEIKYISKQLEICAIETGVALVLGAQLSKAVEDESTLISKGLYSIAEGHDISRTAANMYGIWNRGMNPVDPSQEIVLTVLKGREIGRGHEKVFSFDGNLNKVSDLNEHSSYKPAEREEVQPVNAKKIFNQRISNNKLGTKWKEEQGGVKNG